MRHDVVIYATSSGTAGLYDRAHGRAGGAERQMTLLARALVDAGLDVAHVTYRPKDPVPLEYPLTLVWRDPHRGGRHVFGRLLEARAIWRAFAAADADVAVVRTASPQLAVTAAFSRLRRRALVFSSSNVSDFTQERMGSRLNRLLYGIGIRLADVVVVQSDDQIRLARSAFPSLRDVVRIPSFAETAPADDPAVPSREPAFLWLGRCVPQKQPLRYVELAKILTEARFVMVPVPHEGSEHTLEEVRRTARDVTNLELLDPLPHEEVVRLMRDAVAVVNTSVLEGMPNTFLEAWAAGVPVLTLDFDPDGVVERNGLGVSARGSWERFVAGARELWQTRDANADVRDRVRVHVAQTHSLAAVGARWAELIARLRGRRRVAAARVAQD